MLNLMAYFDGKRFYSSYFASQTFSESLIFFTGTIPTVSIAIVPIFAWRYSFTQACTPHPARVGKEKKQKEGWVERGHGPWTVSSEPGPKETPASFPEAP